MKKYMKNSLLAALALLLLTIFHHVYGARIFATPWRLHIITPSLITLSVITLLYYLFLRTKNKVFFTLYTLSVGITFGVLLGGFEGFYNHLLKNLLFFSGTEESTMEVLFPPPAYEMPSDFIFEFTGIMQAIPGAIIIYSLWKAVKIFRKNTNEVEQNG